MLTPKAVAGLEHSRPKRSSPGSRAHTALAASLLLVALAVGTRLLYGPNIRDDAYITLRYAVNLASGYGFVFNPGEAVLGTTTPLYTLILAALALAGLEPTSAAVGIGILSDAVAVFLVFQLAWQGKAWYPALSAALGYALFLPLVAHAVSGMETSLYSMLILATVLAYSRGKLTLAAILAALVAFLRPDGAMLAVAIAGYHIWRRKPIALGPVVLFIIILLPWEVFSTLYFGSLIPNSLPAKLHYGGVDPFLSVRNLLSYFFSTDVEWLLPATLLALLGSRRCWRAGHGHRALTVWAALYIVAFTAANKFLYPGYPFEWYFVPLLLPLALSAGHGIEGLVARAQLLCGSRKAPVQASRYLAATALLLFGSFYGFTAHQGYSTLRMFADGREGLYREIAARLVRYGAKEAVAAPEIGTLGYYYPGPFLDLEGLVSPQVIALGYADSLRVYRPAWLVSWDSLVPEEVRTEPWFDAEYRPVFVLKNWEGRQAVLFRRYPTSRDDGSRELYLGGILRLNGIDGETPAPGNGGLLRVRLDWDLLRPVDRRYAFFVHLLDASGNVLAQQDNEPQEGTRHLDTFPPGHLVDLYDLQVPSGVDLAGARIAVGAYRVGDPSDHLSWTTRAGSDLGWELSMPLGLRDEAKSKSSATFRDCWVEFGDTVALLGYSVDTDRQEGWRMTLFWKSLRPVSQDYSVFVHALDDHGRIVGQADGQPGGGRYPTSIWLQDETVQDLHELPVSQREVAAVRVGLYRLPGGQRLPVGGPIAGDSVIIDPGLAACQVSGS